jgi:hypothetical protein
MMRASDSPRRPLPEDERFLDVLVFLRRLYQHRGPQDSVATVPLTRLLGGPDPLSMERLAH